MDMAFAYCCRCKIYNCKLRYDAKFCEDCENYLDCNICCDECEAGHKIAKDDCYKPRNDWWEEYGYYEAD